MRRDLHTSVHTTLNTVRKRRRARALSWHTACSTAASVLLGDLLGHLLKSAHVEWCCTCAAPGPHLLRHLLHTGLQSTHVKTSGRACSVRCSSLRVLLAQCSRLLLKGAYVRLPCARANARPVRRASLRLWRLRTGRRLCYAGLESASLTRWSGRGMRSRVLSEHRLLLAQRGSLGLHLSLHRGHLCLHRLLHLLRLGLHVVLPGLDLCSLCGGDLSSLHHQGLDARGGHQSAEIHGLHGWSLAQE
jgi:hypothetical protein